MNLNNDIVYNWIWLDTTTGDCITTASLSELCKLIGLEGHYSYTQLINTKKYKKSKYRFWAQIEILNV